jgi:hypothetical protein
MSKSKSICGQNSSRIRRRSAITLAPVSSQLFLLLLLTILLSLALVADIRSIPDGAQRHDGHEEDAHNGPADENPSHALYFRLGIAAEHDTDFVGDLLNLENIYQ